MVKTPRFIQISTLSNYPAVLLNRDDSGLAKRMPFGGVVRTRVSSQCLKRHWRACEDEYALDNIDEGLSKSIRSRKVYSLRIAVPLTQEGYPEEVVKAVIMEFQKYLHETKERSSNEQSEQKEGVNLLDRSEIVVLGEPEINFLKEHTRKLCDAAGNDSKKAATLAKNYLRKEKKNFLALKCGAGIDGAMFGRFVSGDPDARISAAVHVAHSFTVHEETSETDYFTAVDDLIEEVGETGSAHIGASELTSGLFYTYLVVDVPQLVANLEGINRKYWMDADRALASKTVEHLIHLVAKVSPGAKLGATAPYSYASFVLAEMGNRQPRTLANAFLAPISLDTPDIFGTSLNRLNEHLKQTDDMYGAEEERLVACRREASFIEAKQVTLPELAAEVRKVIKA